MEQSWKNRYFHTSIEKKVKKRFSLWVIFSTLSMGKVEHPRCNLFWDDLAGRLLDFFRFFAFCPPQHGSLTIQVWDFGFDLKMVRHFPWGKHKKFDSEISFFHREKDSKKCTYKVEFFKFGQCFPCDKQSSHHIPDARAVHLQHHQIGEFLNNILKSQFSKR